jgi:signal transduction histidine kinase
MISGLIIVLLSVGLLVLGWRLHRIRVVLSDLVDAVSRKAPYLREEPSGITRRFRIDQLIELFAVLRDKEQQMQVTDQQIKHQWDAVLGRVRAAVFSVGPFNQVLYANEAAAKAFGAGVDLKGKRMEDLIRNPVFLDYAHQHRDGVVLPALELDLGTASTRQWYEVSAALLPGPAGRGDDSVLFVFHDITRLKELEVVKNNFVANVSHELKTPITIIKGFAEALIDDDDRLDAAMRLHFLRKIESNAERLHLIVQDLLTLSRIESEPHYLKRAPHEMAPLLASIRENCRSLLQPDQVLEFEDDSNGLLAEVDGFKVTQVFQNLIDNAIRYAGPSAHIRVRVEAQDADWLRCSVCDNGPGVPAEDLPHVFRRFYRVDKARTRSTGGTGLGLSIALGIVELHGGRVVANNRPEGGLCVSFTLPLSSESF